MLGKSCPLGCFTLFRLNYVPSPFGVWDRMWNSIESVPDRCLPSTLDSGQ